MRAPPPGGRDTVLQVEQNVKGLNSEQEATRQSSVSRGVGGPTQRCRSQRQMDASSHTAMRMLLSRLKLV